MAAELEMEASARDHDAPAPGPRAPVPFTKALYRMLKEEPAHICYRDGGLVIPSPRDLETARARARGPALRHFLGARRGEGASSTRLERPRGVVWSEEEPSRPHRRRGAGEFCGSLEQKSDPPVPQPTPA